jgi:hypothetical protein
MQQWDTEDGHDRVADELLHGAAVPFERTAGLDEEALHHAAGGLRIHRLAQGGRAGHVGEDHGHDFARPRHRGECTTHAAP